MSSVEATSRLDSSIERVQKRIRILIWLIVPILIITIVLAWIFYPVPYNFFQEYISRLGRLVTPAPGAVDNSVSSLIMTIGFGIISGIMVLVSLIYFFKRGFRFKWLKSLWAFIIAIGAATVAIPVDHPIIALQWVHIVGVVVFVFAFAIFNGIVQVRRFTRKHRTAKKEKRNLDFYFDIFTAFLVFLTLGFFLVTFILSDIFGLNLGVVTPELAQKIILIVDCIAVFELDISDI